MKKQLVFNRPVWIFLLFLVGSFLFVDLNFRYWFHFMEQFMLFQTTSVYWKELAAQLGGWNEYIAEYLTQAFSFAAGPAILVTTLSGLIALLFYKYQQACCGKASMGLSILPLFLFWLFPSETIVPMLVLVWALAGTVVCQSISNRKIRMLVGVLLVPLLYYVAVPAPFLYAVLLLLHEWMRADQRKPYLYTGVLLAWTFLLPLLVMRLWLVVPMREVWMGKYMYHPEYPVPQSFWLIFLSFPVLTLVGRLCAKWQERLRPAKWLAAECIFWAGLMAALIALRKDPMQQAYQYDYYARNGAWDKIVAHAEKEGVHDFDALVYVNLALSYTGRQTTDLMKFPQVGETGFIPHDPRTRLGLIQASEVAWQVGQVNAAQRFAFVGVLSSQRCVQPRLMKRLVETYLVNGEYRAAEKYIRILEQTPRYKAWAAEQRQYLGEKESQSAGWIQAKRAFLPVTDNPFDLTKTLPSALAFLIDDHPDNQAAFDYGMCYLLVYKNLSAFMHYMPLYKERHQSFPKLYQEAICLYYASKGKMAEAANDYPIDSEVTNRMQQFLKTARSLSAANLKQLYGDTYYYYTEFMPTPKQ